MCSINDIPNIDLFKAIRAIINLCSFVVAHISLAYNMAEKKNPGVIEEIGAEDFV